MCSQLLCQIILFQNPVSLYKNTCSSVLSIDVKLPSNPSFYLQHVKRKIKDGGHYESFYIQVSEESELSNAYEKGQ